MMSILVQGKISLLLSLSLELAKFIYSLMAQTVKIPPTMQKAWVLSLGQKDPLEK